MSLFTCIGCATRPSPRVGYLEPRGSVQVHWLTLRSRVTIDCCLLALVIDSGQVQCIDLLTRKAKSLFPAALDLLSRDMSRYMLHKHSQLP